MTSRALVVGWVVLAAFGCGGGGGTAGGAGGNGGAGGGGLDLTGAGGGDAPKPEPEGCTKAPIASGTVRTSVTPITRQRCVVPSIT